MNCIKSLAGILVFFAVLIAPFALFPGCGALPPMITSLVADPAAIPVEGTTMISCEATSSSAANLTYTWSAEFGTLSSTSGNTVYWTAPSTKGSYTIVVIVSDGSQSVSNTVTIYVTDRTSPIVTSVTASPATVITGGSSTISCEAVSPYSSSLTYTWVATGGTLSSSGGKIVTWTAPTTTGTYTITVVVSDGSTTTSNSTQITVNDPEDPVITNLKSTPTKVAINKTSVLTCEASDPNGYSLGYSWTASGGTLLSSNGPTVEWRAPSSATTSAVSVTVTNSKAQSTTGNLNIVSVVPGTPTIEVVTYSQTTVSVSSTISILVTASDPDGLDLTYYWTCSGGSYTATSNNTATWLAPSAAGSYNRRSWFPTGPIPFQSQTITVN